MFRIDLAFLKFPNLTTKDKQQIQNRTNEIFEFKIYDLYSDTIVKSECDTCDSNLTSFQTWDERNIIEVESEGFWGRHFCEIPENYDRQISVGDYIVETDGTATDVAIVRETGKMVNLKRNKMGLANEHLPVLRRVFTNKDMERYKQNLMDEKAAEPIFRDLVAKHNLEMKLINIHYQFDRKKLYFFYTADGRVDFRELAKDLANQFRTRIELRQIGVRDEAQKLGGIGTCGREFCCSTFLKSFKRIPTQMVMEQNLSVSASKLSGPCGKLKCCLSFELPENN